MQIRLNNLNIDNNYEFATRYPVQLTPLKYNDFKKGNKYFLNILLNQNIKEYQCLFYEKIIFDFDPIVIRMGDGFLSHAANFSS